jgi:UDP:flavonoid glycosyltransferase YjiC (YdhE family)
LLKAMRHHKARDPYQYTFDPMSSDSDSSSSDDDDAWKAPARPRRLTRNKSKVEKEEEQKEKQDAKQGRSFSRFHIGNEHFKTKGKVSKRDGRLNISVNETANNGYLAKALGHGIRHHLDIPNRKERKQQQHVADHAKSDHDADAKSLASSMQTVTVKPRLNVVIMVIGSRGDVQPFLKIGKILKEDYGYRVRVATHPTFRDFVEKDGGLEFFSIGGDPSELMAFMVKNPGLIPNLQTIREGEIPRRRQAMGEMFNGMYRACVNSTDDEQDQMNLKLVGHRDPFVADAIIANPPSMAHVHIAERLGIPLHIMFTFPYSPTQAFPHPLANIRPGKSNVDANYVNFMSYPLVEMMTWQGLGDIVNKFRVKTLGLEPVSSLWAPGALYRMNVPYTYLWSPSLCPKPNDWGPNIDISGFVFLEQAKTYKPPEDLQKFLDGGDAPIYIGFGSIVVEDPNKFTKMIFEATKIAGVRALVNKGWGGLGVGNDETPDNIFMLDSVPHDWLFPRCKAVVHHGGAGTTAMGIKCAKPTMIVPFFGDQPFWAARVTEAKAGAHEVIPWKRLTAEKLAEGIKQCLTEESQKNVQKLADGIAKEGDGAANACRSFERALPLAGERNIRCSILEDRVAVWRIRGSALRLSALAAEILMEKGEIRASDLRLLHKVQWNDFDGPGEPVTGTVGAVSDSLYGIGAGLGMVPVRMARHLSKRAEHERKKTAIQCQKEDMKLKKAGGKGGKSNPVPDSTGPRPASQRVGTNNTLQSQLSADPHESVARELARDVRDGFKESGWALFTMPNDLHMAIAQGFHNAPRLWGDATVRKPTRITGVKSGFTAARRELCYGIYDGWTGLITQPVGGYKDGLSLPGKLAGMGTGVGKGLGGFVMKNVSAIVSPPAYAGKGFMVYLKKKRNKDGPGSKASIRRAHLIQGQKDLQALKDGPRDSGQLQAVEQQVSKGWKVYTDIWQEAYDQYGPVGGGLVNRFKLNREKRRWRRAGALENIHTADRALQHAKRGDDLEAHFARRKREMQRAEQPRAAGMDSSAADRQPVAVDPRLHHVDTTYATDEAERMKLAPRGSHATDRSLSRGATAAVVAVGEEEDRKSDSSTIVATSEDDEQAPDRALGTRNHRGVDGDGVLVVKAAARGGRKPALAHLTTA